jgi:endonuclease/exonuclease/phosphatase (EEP) superfamily protein YafD
MSESLAIESAAPAPRRRGIVLRLLAQAWAFVAIASLAGVWTGVVVRDRWEWSQLLWFVPVMPVGVVVLLMDLVRLGRTIRPRFGVSVAALVTIAFGIWHMIGGSPEPVTTNAPTIRVLQWNVLWGVLPNVWPTVASDIRAQGADIVILSESANRWQIADELAAHGIEHFVIRENPPRQPYTWRLVVASRWPVEFESLDDIPTGKAMRVRVEAPGRAIRILLVDGGSNPFELRRPRTEAVARMVDDCKANGTPIDFIAGDFNTPGCSVGFDALRATGWTFAEDSSGTWRGTFRWWWAPFWDIDHVIVSPDWAVRKSVYTSHEWLDHRGQVVDIGRR